jgi:hypothetical protein
MGKSARSLYAITVAISLSSCNTVPDNPDFEATLNGNYKAIADCAILEFRKDWGWSRTDLDTMKRIEFVQGDSSSGSIVGIITLEPIGADRTRIVSRVQRAIYGADFYANINRPIFERCARG